MNKLYGYIAIFYLGLMIPTHAQEAYLLSDCYRLALQQSEVLQQEQVIQAEARYQQALAGLWPTLSGTAFYFKQDQTTSDQSYIKGTFSQPLFRGFRYLGAVKQNEKLIQAQQEAKKCAAMQLYEDVAQAFYLILYLKADQKLQEEQLAIYDKRITELRERVAKGRSRNADVLSIEVSRSQLKAQLIAANAQLQTASHYLQFLIGLNQEISLIEPTANLKMEPLAVYQAKIEARPDIAAAKHRLEVSELGVSVAAVQWEPNVDAAANMYLIRPNSGALWDAQIAVSLPNFFTNMTELKVQDAQSSVRQNQINLQQLIRKTKTDIEDVYASLCANQSQVNALSTALEFAAQNVATLMQDYRFGLSNNLEVLQAINTKMDMLRLLNKVQYAAKMDAAKLASTVGDIPEVPIK